MMFFIASIAVILFTVIYLGELIKKLKQEKPQQIQLDFSSLQKAMDDMPNKVFQTIVGSSNTTKGALGELVGYLNIRSQYDRIIPLGDITDFVGIKLPTMEGDKEIPGHIDFIDIKTGEKSKLSKDQKALQKLIKDKKINFITLKIDSISSEDIFKSS